MPKFSVVIPLYNKEDYVTATVNSVLAQSITDLEILIVNDCSTDRSLSVVEKFEDSRIKIIQNPTNKGLSASRNVGIQNACGTYIAFLDADDTWLPNFLSLITELITEFPGASLFGTNYEEVHSDKTIFEPQKNLPKDFKKGIIDDFFTANLHQPIYCPSSLCVHHKIFDTLKLYDESITFAEDLDFNIRANLLFKTAYTIAFGARYTMYSQNQITLSKISDRVIPDFQKYDKLHPNNKSLKLYLDFQRYVIAKQFKYEGYTIGFNKLRDEIDIKNLNYKQRFLLTAPTIILSLIRKTKLALISRGIRFTTYRSQS